MPLVFSLQKRFVVYDDDDDDDDDLCDSGVVYLIIINSGSIFQSLSGASPEEEKDEPGVH